MAVGQEIKEVVPRNVDLFVVGVDVSFTKDGELNTFEPGGETDMQALTLFGWAEKTGHNGLPLLAPFPLSKGIGEERAEKISQLMTEKLQPAFSQVNGVSEDVLRFPLLENIKELFDKRLRHEAGYALLLLSKEDGKQEVPQEFQEAIWNTGNLLLRTVGVDWWIEEDKKAVIEEAYNEHFHDYWDDLPSLFDPNNLGPGFASEFDMDMVLTHLSVMRNAKEIKASLDYEEIAELGHGFTYIAKHVAEKTELIFGPRWISTRSTPVGASWVGIQGPAELQIPLPAPFS